MKKLLSVCLAVFLLLGASFGEDISLLQLEEAKVEAFSMLPWRGLEFDRGTSLYGKFSVYGDFSIGLFQYTSWDNVADLQNDELDFLLSYRISMEDLQCDIIYTEYNLPGQSDWFYTREIGFSLKLLDKF